MNIGDIFWAFRGDGSQLMVDAQKAGAAAGLKGGQAFSTSFRAKAINVAGGAIGAAFGAAVGVALTGARELDAVTRQLQADAGLTAQEAEEASHAIAGMYRNNLQGFDEIGAALGKVYTDLGLTGDAAEEAANQFLRFSTATGQDAAEAVTELDDILDAWGLTAQDAAGVMDQLVASHQEYGGSITENQKALATLAPQLQALGMSLDDGVGLLNLFAASGLDSAKATFALNTAVKNLKPGESLNDLIAQVSAIEDPTLRAQKAIEIFGARGGVSLANVLRPGIDSLDDFAITAEESAGAAEAAADAVESSWGAQFQLLVKNAGGALADFGQKLGPLLMLAAAFGPQFTRAVTTGIGGIAGALASRLIPAILGTAPAAAVAGEAVGTATAGGVASGVAKSGGLIQRAVAFALSPAGFLAAGVALPLVMFNVIPAMFAGPPGSGAKTMDTAAGKLDAQVTGMYQGLIPGWTAMAEKAGATVAESTAEGIEEGTPVVTGAVTGMAAAAEEEARRSVRGFEDVGAAIPESIAAGVLDEQGAVLDAFDTLKNLMKNALTPAQRIARNVGILTSKALAQGLEDKRPEVQAEAERVQAMAEQELAELIAGGGHAGKKAMDELRDGLHSKNPQVRAAAQRVKELIEGRLEATDGKGAGKGIDQDVATGLRTGTGPVFRAAASVARDIATQMARTLHYSTTYGGRGRALGGPVELGHAYWVGEEGPELFVAPAHGRIIDTDTSQRVAAGGMSPASPAGPGATYNIPLTVQGALPVRTIRDIQTELRRVGDLGIMPPRMLSPQYPRREAAGA